MTFRLILGTDSKKTMRALASRKSSVLLSLSITLVFLLLLSSLGNANLGNANVEYVDSFSDINQSVDTDYDGLADELEDRLGTDKNNWSGDMDNDGLYDFEEYLDYYGTPNNSSDDPKYKYNDSTSYGAILDIYHYFNLSSNKTSYLRDQNFTETSGGFTDYLLWNVNFIGNFSGGSYYGDVIYRDNLIRDSNFGDAFSGGSYSGDVSYDNNTLLSVHFTGPYSGGSYYGDVSYTNNSVSDILLSGMSVSESQLNSSNYTNNVLVSDNFDTDRDGLGDGRELFETGTNPRDDDTDGDGTVDGDEVFETETETDEEAIDSFSMILMAMVCQMNGK